MQQCHQLKRKKGVLMNRYLFLILGLLLHSLAYAPCCTKLPCQSLIKRNHSCKKTRFCCTNASNKTLCCLGKTILKNVCCLEAQITECCNNIANLTPCGKVIPIGQADLPANLVKSGFYCLKENVVFDGDTVKNPGAAGPIGIAANAQNIVIDLNQHTFSFKGKGTNAIATIGKSAHVTIKNGTIIGSPTDQFEAAILILTNNITVENVRIVNVGGLNSFGSIIRGAFLANPQSQNVTFVPISDTLIQNCAFENDNYGIEINTQSNGVTIKDCTIDNSIQMGITQPTRNAFATDVLIDHCTISNSGLNGIYTTFSQANWTINNCTISNTGLNGMILAGFQNLVVSNCQVFDSGAHGIVASIRHSSNVTFDNCQIFNAQDSALRVDNVENLLIQNCSMTNFIATTSPVCKLQDIFNGTIINTRVNSSAGTADGFLLRNCHGLTFQDDTVQVYCNTQLNAAEGTPCPIGFNLVGNVEGCTLDHCSVTGNPATGIALEQDSLNGPNDGVIISNCTIKGATTNGIFIAQTTPPSTTTPPATGSRCMLLSNQILGGAGNGILLGAQTSLCAVRDNTLINNAGIGIANLGVSNAIFHNFAQNNGTNFSGVPADLITPPVAHVGVLENIDVN